MQFNKMVPSISLQIITNQNSIHIFFILYSSDNGHLGSFYNLTVVGSAYFISKVV